MSTLSELLPAGGGGSTVDFVASGTLPNGKPVILKANGQVEVVSEVVDPTIVVGSPVVYESADARTSSIVMLTATKAIVVYQDYANSSYGTACILNISGTTITAGTPAVFASSSITSFDSLALSATKALVTFRNNGNSLRGTGCVLSVSGSSITAGTHHIYDNARCDENQLAKLTDTKAMVVFSAYGRTEGYADILDISGTTITSGSTGSSLAFENSRILNIQVVALTSTKALVTYKDLGNNYATACVLDVSGSTITAGTPSALQTSDISYPALAALTATKAIMIYSDQANTNRASSRILDVSGTTITPATPLVYDSAEDTAQQASIATLTATKAVGVYKDRLNSQYGTAVTFNVSGSTVTLVDKEVFESGITVDPSVIALDSSKAIVAFQDNSNSNYGTSVVFTTQTSTTNLTSTNFVGTSTAAYTNGQTATIAVQGGLSTNQTGLTIGSTYFVQPTGTLATTAGTPSVNAGKALSATTLLLKDL